MTGTSTARRSGRAAAWALAVGLCVTSGAAFAQSAQPAVLQEGEASEPARAAGTGDVWLDAYLADINVYGRQYRAAFVDELVRYYAAPRAMAVQLLDDDGWQPGDLLLACAVAQRRGRPCRYVVERFDAAQGWTPVLQAHDMAEGSPDLHRIKRSLVETYRRWARPILLDGALQADFPERAKDPANRFVAPAPADEDRGAEGD
ncbi:MAG: hypothetical protein A2579_02095 [Lysobacterales bacterium RIFOXYD1_FULL_69_11]|nr:MAG: hypothetical protein A2190_05350 [Xanthomonadales bacterium RIFOXYA1_FULL_69_10]OHE88641.1 MAG: hypothetical protein A2579_02095 [Xanthomonadales bacterium RIFOXYD1_FULL_69_11]